MLRFAHLSVSNVTPTPFLGSSVLLKFVVCVKLAALAYFASLFDSNVIYDVQQITLANLY